MLKVKKLRKLPPCSTLYGNIIISETQVFVQGFPTLVCIMYNAKDTHALALGFPTLVCIMYNAKDTHALAGRAKEGNDLLVWVKKFSPDLSFYI